MDSVAAISPRPSSSRQLRTPDRQGSQKHPHPGPNACPGPGPGARPRPGPKNGVFFLSDFGGKHLATDSGVARGFPPNPALKKDPLSDQGGGSKGKPRPVPCSDLALVSYWGSDAREKIKTWFEHFDTRTSICRNTLKPHEQYLFGYYGQTFNEKHVILLFY